MFLNQILNTLVKTGGYTPAYLLNMVKYTNVLYCIMEANLIWAYRTVIYSTWGEQTGHIDTLHMR